MILLSTTDHDRYFLVPHSDALKPGALRLQSLTGETLEVSAQAVAPYEVPEAVARTWAEEQAGQLASALATAKAQFDQRSAEVRSQLDALLRRAGTADPSNILETLGIDPAGKPDAILRQLEELVQRLGVELPEAARDLRTLQGKLPQSWSNAGTETSGPSAEPLDNLLGDIENDPDADPQLREAAAELQAFARSLDGTPVSKK